MRSTATGTKAGSTTLGNTATGTKAADNSWTIHVTNILNTSSYAVNGHAVAFDSDQNKTSASTQNFFNSSGAAVAGPLSWSGGKNKTANGLGYNYKFQNIYVLSEEGGLPVCTDDVSSLTYVKKIQYKGNNEMIVTLSDGTTQTLDSNEVYISPVYSATASWYLIYEYTDNISTGSGSWSNADSIVEYKHTFTNPEDKSPGLTEGKYSFRYWENDETKEKYLDVTDPDSPSEFVYSGAELNQGDEKKVKVYAYWQPAISVVYNVLGQVADTVKNVVGDSITVYDKTADSTVDNVTFEGWYDADGNRISEDTVYDAPGITKDADTAVTYNVFARYATSRSVQKVWDDSDNADGIRSASVTVQLYANGEPTGKTIELSSANSWAAAFSDLDAYDKDGNLIEYTINEEAIPQGYSASIAVDGTSFTITNTHVLKPAPGGTEPGTDPSDDPKPDPGKDPSGTDPSNDPDPTGGNGNRGDNGTTGGNGGNGGTTAMLTGATGTTTLIDTDGPGTPGATGANKPAATVIDEPEPPLALNAYWALVNLLCAIATALLSIIMLVRYFGKRREEDEETGEETEIKRKGGVRLASIIPAIGAIIVFILTEDMTNPMIMVDRWTLLMIVILAVQVAVAIIAKTKKNDEQEEPAEAMA